MRRSVAAGCCLLAFATASCAAIFGFDRLEEGPASAPDGSPSGEASVPDVVGPDPRCAALGLPAPPVDAGGGGSEIFAALRTLDLGIDSAGNEPSFGSLNLDGVCTNSPETSSCTLAQGTANATFIANIADKTNAVGGDNAGFGLIRTLSAVEDTAITQEAVNQGVRDGRYGAVFHVTQWNGSADDDSVVVEVFPAAGFGDGTTKPAFVPGDRWRLDARYRLANLSQAVPDQTSQLAYFTGGTLVARFERLTIPLRIGDDPKPFDINLREVILTGRVPPGADAGAFLENGLIAGRWPTAELLDQVRSIFIRDGNNVQNVTICRDDPLGFYNLVKAASCGSRDIRADSQDNQGKPCDALSFAAHVEGYRLDGLGSTFVDAGDYGGRCASGVVVDAGDCNLP